jgi:transcriptional regulator with XRE-family HTH domain
MVLKIPKTVQKKSAIELRERGFSYSEIRRVIPVPKSTLSLWLRGIKLPKIYKDRLSQKRLKAALDSAEKRKKEKLRNIAEIKNSATRDIKEISKREFWLMGLMIYWAFSFRGENNNSSYGVQFSSSNPYMVKFFLDWLINIGRIDKSDIAFDIFLNENDRRMRNKIIKQWSAITNFPPSFFPRVYFLKNNPRRSSRKKARHNLLQIRVKKSSLLRRQIDGWIRGIIRQLWGMAAIDNI